MCFMCLYDLSINLSVCLYVHLYVSIPTSQAISPYIYCYISVCLYLSIIITWLRILGPQTGEELVSLRHSRSKEVRRSAASLEHQWEELKRAMFIRGKALEDNRDFLEFLQKVEEVEAWIRLKVRKEGGMEG